MNEADDRSQPDAHPALVTATDAERRGVDKTLQRLGRMGHEVSACAGQASPDDAGEAFIDELQALAHG